MSNVSLSQLLIIILLAIFLFGDVSNIIKSLTDFVKRFNAHKIFIKKKDRKKGS
jgi:Sec-independent protein translocase protein TatA